MISGLFDLFDVGDHLFLNGLQLMVNLVASGLWSAAPFKQIHIQRLRGGVWIFPVVLFWRFRLAAFALLGAVLFLYRMKKFFALGNQHIRPPR